MNKKIHSTCPHDCPSTCSLEVELLSSTKIGRIHGAIRNKYTDGIICAKVARYAERIHHPKRLKQPLRRIDKKGIGRFEKISWEEALDEVADVFLKVEKKFGSEAVWPYHFAGTMGLIQRDGINRLRHVKKYSGQMNTICAEVSRIASRAGTGKQMGPDPREIAFSDLIVIWGTNAASTQINFMSHAIKARKSRNAKIIVVDTYETQTAKQADEFFQVLPGSDGALACAIMHVLFRDNLADRAFMAKYADCPSELEKHLIIKTPLWAESICGVSAKKIEKLASLIGNTPKTYLRLGYGFTRQRNGAVAMHSAFCIATVSGAWAHEGGGAFHSNGDLLTFDKTQIEGLDALDKKIRVLDMSRIGAVLCGDKTDLGDGPPVKAMLIQSTNPMSVAPNQNLVKKGFEREDLFVCVHEQFMTETAMMADIILPATMFLEHDDVYRGSGHQHISIGPKIINGPEFCRSNHFVICEIAKRVGAKHSGFNKTAWQLINDCLKKSGYPDAKTLKKNNFVDCQPDFATSHYLDGFAHADGKFHFKANWGAHSQHRFKMKNSTNKMPSLPDHWDVIEKTTKEFPFKLVTAPARNFLNSTFNETKTSYEKEKEPQVKINSSDAKLLSILNGDRVRLGNKRGSVVIKAEIFDGTNQGVVIVEGLWPNDNFEEKVGINALTGDDPTPPVGGVPFHDNAIWINKV